MTEDLQTIAEREVARVDSIVERMSVIDQDRAASLRGVLMSYYQDCKGFFQAGKYLQCIEAAFICWAYVDAGLHLKVFSVPEDMQDIFTV
ncbi:MAG: hypothetical protein HY833_03760 [Candidatus Aenigmarchaeota archaeon]|nr:hypothetical protein [Candidatus Aenigmarchaeota archaeon]